MKFKKLLGTIIGITLLCSCSTQRKVNESTDPIKDFLGDYYLDANGEMIVPLDTTVSLITYDPNYEPQAYEILQKEVEIYHKFIDSNHDFLDESGNKIHNLKYLNDSYGSEEAIEVDQIVIDILKDARDLMILSRGKFNMTLGTVINLYEDKFNMYDTIQSDPSSEDMAKALACSVSVDDLDKFLEIDEEHNTVTLHKVDTCEGKVTLQLGAMSKGFIAREIGKKLNDLDISYLISLGTSSQTFNAGKYDTKSSWLIAINNPYNTSEYEFAIRVNGSSALSTSGDYEKYYLIENEDGTYTRRMHILDSTTGYSNSYYREIAVFAEGIGSDYLDALSTTLFNVESEVERKEIINDFNEHYQTNISYALVKEVDAEKQKVVIICNQSMKDAIEMKYLHENVEEIIVE